MKDLDIIKLIEKELRFSIPIDKEEESSSNNFILNDSGSVITLHIIGCQINNLNRIIAHLNELQQLTELNLSNNELSDIAPLKELQQLTELNLSNNELSDIAPLKELQQLTELNLSYNELSDITPLKELHQLVELDLTENQLKDLSPLGDLKNLKKIYLHSNNLTDISIIKELKKIEGIYCVNNEISDILPFMSLKHLKDLYIGHNEIIEISALQKIKSLQRLYIPNNKVFDITPLKELKNLQYLNLGDNPIKKIPEWITNFNMKIIYQEDKRKAHRESNIIFFDNPLESPPVEIIKKGNQAIKRYFEKIKKEGIDNIYEAKIIFVGEGSSGKTSLQKRLIRSNALLPKKDERTRGIEISDWIFKKNRGKKHIAHIWDFGGQDVYYPVHRFFLTENSVFVLLASTRQTHHNFDYWIPTIYQFGGKSPIILGQTCHDGNKVSWNDLGVYVGNPNFNIIKTQELFYEEINLTNKNEGLEKIKQNIVSQIIGLPHYGKGVPKSWVPIRNILSNEFKKTACISFEKFTEICKTSNPKSFSKIADVKDCCQFLHDIGVVLWYSTNDELKDFVILQPEWAMNAVYKIIDDGEIQKRRGNILAKDFNRLWQDVTYADKHIILKKMLEVFKIAFPKKHKHKDYIIPARLLSMPIEKRWKYDEPSLRLEYRYEFMPRGIVNQVSADLSRYIVSDEEVWNNAVNFSFENSKAFCQMEEDFYNRKITIRAKGKDARGLNILVMDALKNITDGYKGVMPDIHVPCTCNYCKNNKKPTTFLYDKLIDWSTKREKAQVICNESGVGLLIEELLYNIGLSTSTNSIKEKHENRSIISKNLFISYSKFDEDYLQDFQDHLVTLKEEGLVTFDCREIEFGNEWDKEIKKKIDECDVMVCLVSVKFLNTDYIKKIEIKKAINQNKTIIPIIIKACDWESSVLGRYQAAQRGKVVSLDNNKRLLGEITGNSNEEKDAFWTAIVKEFRKKIFK